MKIFAKLMKVDVEKRQVWGRATQEVPDKAREIFDYATSVPHFKEWSASFEKATEILGEAGKSLGNIRAMHGKVAAGKVIAIDFNDAEKAIDIGTEITDDAEWGKVLKGTYTGFSIGGNYIKQWKDDANTGLTRFTAAPSEISIVDNPCVPTATFSLVKADGVVEETPFAAPAAEVPAVPAADGSGGEELDVSAIDPATLKAFLSTRRTELAAAIAAAKAVAILPVKKSLYSVSSLAELLCAVNRLAEDAQWEADYEKDESAVPVQLREWLSGGAAILTAMTAEETAEMLAAATPDSLAMAAAGDLQKRADDALTKVADLEKSVTTLTAEKAALEQQVTALAAEPAPAKGVVKVIAKADDVPEPKTIELPDPSSPHFAREVMKAVHQQPIVINR